MTCAPDAFNAPAYPFDAGLVVIEPGQSFEASWTISAID
jgi:aldose 1-epimerase